MISLKKEFYKNAEIIAAVQSLHQAVHSSLAISQQSPSQSVNSTTFPSAPANLEIVGKNKTSYFSPHLSNEAGNEFDEFNIRAQQASNKIISLIKSEDYIEGEMTKTQIYLESLYRENKYLFKDSFQKSWVKLFSAKPYILRNFVCVASCLDYSWLEDKALVLVLGASNHQDKYVNEAALRAAESWENPEFISILENIKEFDVDWLDNYKEEVIAYLREMQ